jgi:hypothetical protein
MPDCDLMLMEHEDAGDRTCAKPAHRDALQARRAAKEGKWSPIVRGHDSGGKRDFLDGKPVHCGATLELQAVETREDDYGQFSVWTQVGVRVRYELEPNKGITLYAAVAGFNFTHRHDDWMRFRWPRREGS